MSTVSVLNTDSGLSGKTLINAEDAQNITGAKSFNRSPNPPFVVQAGSANVPNLDASLLSGLTSAQLARLDASNTFSAGFLTHNTQPRCKVYKAAVQSIANATANVALVYDTEIFDVGGLHDTGSNTNRITIPASAGGLYLVMAAVGFGSNATGIRELTLRNQAGSVLAEVSAGAVNGDVTVLQAMTLVVLAAADWVESVVYQNSGGSLNVGGDGGSYGWFSAVKLF